MKTSQGYAVGIALTLALGGCATEPQRDSAAFAPPRPAAATLAAATDGAIYRAGGEVRLFEDAKAHRVGDILTVVLAEKTNASKSATTDTGKQGSVNMDNPTLFGLPANIPLGGLGRGMKLNLGTSVKSDQSFKGSGDSSQSNTLTGNITVTVTEVQPNGNLVVRGEKWLTINQGDEYVRISGIVRPQDVTPDNMVSSTSIADAKIAYAGSGTLADSNTMGWLGRFFNSKWWPF